MYKLEWFDGEYAMITGPNYRAESLAGSAAEAEAIAVGLSKPAMLDALAAYRFEFETGGLDLPGGLHILTDRESQAQLSSAFVTLQSGLVADTDWKAANGWEIVTLEQITPIAKAVAAHVRGCFRGERTVQTAIKAASTMTDIESINIRAGFDAAYSDAFAEVMTLEPDPA
ncbi:DUF4376 domain-containing protein [uncultured Pseudomonas sp.]|uniref:DUF4376 domain-containing protein n=1 Tax=uncultured Pseudomonas sp. TaxID=114707 RepID=UPI0025D1C3AA|nr:DUF4376 domain-containing protein [uncultured Pseudomonas sp.]